MKVPAAIAVLALAAGAGCAFIDGSEKLTAAQSFIADAKIGTSHLIVTGGVDRADRTYHPGDKMTIAVRVNRDANVAVLRVLRNGETTRLFPNKHQPKASVTADTTLEIPAAGAPDPITAASSGPVLIEFIASTSGTSWLFTKAAGGSATYLELGATTRAVAKEIADTVRSRGGSEAASAYQIVRIEP